jgi:flagellar biosynthesis chaperone FliJ
MKRFRFELGTLLDLKRHARDDARQALSRLLAQELVLLDRQTERNAQRQVQFNELHQYGAGDELDIEAGRLRRLYAGQLTNELSAIDDDRAALAPRIDAAREKVLRADQEVKALEMLSERKQIAFAAAEERHDTLEVEETWRAGGAVSRAGH